MRASGVRHAQVCGRDHPLSINNRSRKNKRMLKIEVAGNNDTVRRRCDDGISAVVVDIQEAAYIDRTDEVCNDSSNEWRLH